MHKVLITGITGFLGSHIASTLSQNNVEVIGLKREGSDTWRCKEFEQKVIWINIDAGEDWKTQVLELSPTVIIHSAWIGVEAAERENWIIQSQNIEFLVNLLEIGKQVNLKQFIFLGSQAEYGIIDGEISEDQPLVPTNAYGSIKAASLEIMKNYCAQNKITWVWLRLFSLFGEKENENWLIPSVIKKMRTDKEMDFTPGEQKYAYLYVRDFSKIIHQILLSDINSGVYNVSSNEVQELKHLIENIKNIVNPTFKLNFGAIPYRNNQSMHIQGNINKLIGQIGLIEFTDFNVALLGTINYYTSN